MFISPLLVRVKYRLTNLIPFIHFYPKIFLNNKIFLINHFY